MVGWNVILLRTSNIFYEGLFETHYYRETCRHAIFRFGGWQVFQHLHCTNTYRQFYST